MEQQYTGWITWSPDEEELSRFYQTGDLPFTMYENEYLLIAQPSGEVIDKRCY